MSKEWLEKQRILKSEIDFWNRWASENEAFLEPAIPRMNDLGDPFALSSDQAFLDRIGQVSKLRVLDVGCGLGALSIYLANQGAEVVGIDIAEGMTARCRKRASSAGIEAEFVICDAERLPFREGAFDKVVGMRSIHHLPCLLTFFKETDRVLKAGECAVFVEPQKKNLIVEVNRKLLHPDSRTADEHPLVPKDISDAQNVFPDTKIDTFYLISPIAFFFKFLLKSDVFFSLSSRALHFIEKPFCETRLLRRHCWQVLLTLTKQKEARS